MKNTDDKLSSLERCGARSADARTESRPPQPPRANPTSITRSPVVIALRMLLGLTLLTGIFYPLIITLAARAVFPRQATGSGVLAASDAGVNSWADKGDHVLGAASDAHRRFYRVELLP